MANVRNKALLEHSSPEFPSVKSKRAVKHMTPLGLSSGFAEFKCQGGLPKEVVLYSARHTFATDITEATG